MDINRVQEIAQGRVWVGTDALQVGLVDRIGGLDDAIESAATLAGIEEYRLGMYPHFKEPLIEFIESLTGEESVRHKYIAKAKMGELYPYYEFLEEISKVKGVQARLPFFLPFE
jgi:protease-4